MSQYPVNVDVNLTLDLDLIFLEEKMCSLFNKLLKKTTIKPLLCSKLLHNV